MSYLLVRDHCENIAHRRFGVSSNAQIVAHFDLLYSYLISGNFAAPVLN
jgi:hypothetical protein